MGAQQAMARKVACPILLIYIIYNINSTLLAERGMACMRALQVLPLGHHVHLHSDVYIWLSHCPARHGQNVCIVLALDHHLQAQRGMQLRHVRLGSYRMT